LAQARYCAESLAAGVSTQHIRRMLLIAITDPVFGVRSLSNLKAKALSELPFTAACPFAADHPILDPRMGSPAPPVTFGAGRKTT
jgi:hypothetical protein